MLANEDQRDERRQRREDDPFGRQGRVARRGGKVEIRRARLSPRLLFEKMNDLVPVEAEIFGVGAHEADRVDAARQLMRLPVFEGFELGSADAQICLDILKALPVMHTGPAEDLPHRHIGLKLKMRIPRPINNAHDALFSRKMRGMTRGDVESLTCLFTWKRVCYECL